MDKLMKNHMSNNTDFGVLLIYIQEEIKRQYPKRGIQGVCDASDGMLERSQVSKFIGGKRDVKISEFLVLLSVLDMDMAVVFNKPDVERGGNYRRIRSNKEQSPANGTPIDLEEFL